MCNWWPNFSSDVGEIVYSIWGDVYSITIDNMEKIIISKVYSKKKQIPGNIWGK